MSFKVEKEWTTEAGLEARVLFVDDSHNCGYVKIPENSKLYNVGYCDAPSFDVHGGITFSGKFTDTDGYWYGFDAAHLGDKTKYSDYPDGIFRNTNYMVNECEKLAKQIKDNK